MNRRAARAFAAASHRERPGVWIGWPALVALIVALALPSQAQPITSLSIQEATYFYDQPYLLDFNFALRDQSDRAVIVDPAQITVTCREDGTAISASETGFRLLASANKQLKCFLVLDYTLSMADPAVNGDADGDGISDAIETMEASAKTLIGTLNEDAQVGLYEFHREDVAHPPQSVRDLTVDKRALTYTGRVTIRAEQAGNDTYGAAYAKQSFEVIDKLPHDTPLEWLAQYGITNNLVLGELLDPDGDGHAMWQEYWAGTNPTSAASVLALSGPVRRADGWELSFPSQMFRKYRLDLSDDLQDWKPWHTDVPGDGKLLSYVDPQFGPKRFYRLVQTEFKEPPPGMAWIPAGTFTMGSPASEPDSFSDEGPQTTVTISHGFWMGKYEVTQREYEAVTGTNPAYFKDDLDLPVEQVRWVDATNYCGRLTERERAAGRLPEGYEYRLPTEAQWEYACRAGTTTATAFGNSLSSTQANCHGDYPYNGGAKGPYLGRTTKVGSYAANAWGLHDMHGNVWEWCQDWSTDSLPGGRVTDPKGASSGEGRVYRGGGWFSGGQGCRSAYRGRYYPDNRNNVLGFRAALVPVP